MVLRRLGPVRAHAASGSLVTSWWYSRRKSRTSLAATSPVGEFELVVGGGSEVVCWAGSDDGPGEDDDAEDDDAAEDEAGEDDGAADDEFCADGVPPAPSPSAVASQMPPSTSAATSSSPATTHAHRLRLRGAPVGAAGADAAGGRAGGWGGSGGGGSTAAGAGRVAVNWPAARRSVRASSTVVVSPSRATRRASSSRTCGIVGRAAGCASSICSRGRVSEPHRCGGRIAPAATRCSCCRELPLMPNGGWPSRQV